MSAIWSNIPTYIVFLHFIAVIVVLFIERKRADSTIAWVLTLLFVPVVGLLLYIFVGSARTYITEKKFSQKQLADKEYEKVLKEQLDIIKHLNPDDEVLKKYRDMIVMNINSADSLYTNNNDIELFLSGEEKYASLFRDIKNAKKHIHLMYYIFNDDNVGNELIDILCEKAREGVEVRLIYDGFGNIRTKKTAFKRLEKAGGRVVRFLPNQIINLLRVNYRNHRKIAVIDGEIGYIGGINIGDEYKSLDKRKKPWRDTHIRITGTSIVTLQLRFLSDWTYLTGEKIKDKDDAEKYFCIEPKKIGNYALQIVSSGPDSPKQQIKYSVLKMMNKAKNTLYIQTPYFIPDDSIMDALRIAVESGVDVRVMIPGVPDKKFVYHVTLSYVEELLDMGVKVYSYNGFLHSKTVVSDDEITSIGSMNMDIRGFALAFEVTAFIYNEEFAKKCNGVFENDILNSREIKLEEFKKRSLFRKIQESIYRILAPLM